LFTDVDRKRKVSLSITLQLLRFCL